jgi:hypothetical protein
MVIAVGMILTLLVVALLERISAQTLLQRRAQQRYVDHHAEKGMQEAIGAWMTGAANANIDDALDEQGRAFTLSVQQGQTVTVGFEESQGQLLADFAGLSQDELLDAAGAVDELERIAGKQRALTLVRREGPLGVSLRSADRMVIEAVVRAVLPADKAGPMISECMSIQDQLRALARAPRPTAPAAGASGRGAGQGNQGGQGTAPTSLGQEARRLLDEAVARVGVAPGDRERLSRMFSSAPTLYKVWAVAESRGQPPVRYEGLALVRQSSRGAMSGQVQRSSAFLSWTRVETEDARP